MLINLPTTFQVQLADKHPQKLMLYAVDHAKSTSDTTGQHVIAMHATAADTISNQGSHPTTLFETSLMLPQSLRTLLTTSPCSPRSASSVASEAVSYSVSAG